MKKRYEKTDQNDQTVSVLAGLAGFVLRGSVALQCRPEGWDGETPTCEAAPRPTAYLPSGGGAYYAAMPQGARLSSPSGDAHAM